MAPINREILNSHKVLYTKSCTHNQFLFCQKEALPDVDFPCLNCQLKRKKIDGMGKQFNINFYNGQQYIYFVCQIVPHSPKLLFMSPGLIIFARGLRKAYKRRGFYLRGLIGNRKSTQLQCSRVEQNTFCIYWFYSSIKGPMLQLAHSFCLECQ